MSVSAQSQCGDDASISDHHLTIHFRMDCNPILEQHHLLLPAFRRNGDGTVFTGICQHFGGRVVPPSFLTEWIPPSFLMGRGGYPHPKLRQGGTTIPGQDGGYPHPRSGWEGVPPSKVRMMYPPSRSGPRSGRGGGGGGGYPKPEQHSIYLLHDGWYASYVHAGGLSCFHCFQ